MCRWIHKPSGVVFDLMPVQPEVLGFSNRWYPYAVETAVPFEIGHGLIIRLVSAVAFIATKLEAFCNRGRHDFFSSHDLEDVLNVVDGREAIVAELDAAAPEVRQAVAVQISQLLESTDFLNALPGLLSDPDRASVVAERLEQLCVHKGPSAGYVE